MVGFHEAYDLHPDIEKKQNRFATIFFICIDVALSFGAWGLYRAAGMSDIGAILTAIGTFIAGFVAWWFLGD